MSVLDLYLGESYFYRFNILLFDKTQGTLAVVRFVVALLAKRRQEQEEALASLSTRIKYY